MKTGLTRKQKVTEIYFNEHNDITEVYTHNTSLKKRLLKFSSEFPNLCCQTDDDGHGGLRFEIDKRRLSFCVTAPQSRERRDASSQRAKTNGLAAKNPPAD